MTETAAFLLASLALLATPGPTNALLATAGAVRGFRAALRAVPAAIAGYGIAIGLLVGLAGPAMAASPLVAAGLKAAAGLYLIRASLKLWRDGGASPGDPGPAAPGPGPVFVTTLLNPKSLIFAFAILPAKPLADLWPELATLAMAIGAVSTAWIAAGALATRGNRLFTPARISRGSALVLAAFALLLGADATAALAAAAFPG